MGVGVNTLSVTRVRVRSKTYLSNLVRHRSEFDQENTYFLFVSSLNEPLWEDEENFGTRKYKGDQCGLESTHSQ